MTKEEFEQAVREIVEEVYGTLWGPAKLNKSDRFGKIYLKTTPPQIYRDIELLTREDIRKRIGGIYLALTDTNVYPLMGPRYTYSDGGSSCVNWPQRIPHTILGELVVESMKKMTVREIGCHVFEVVTCGIREPQLMRMLTIYKIEYKKIMSAAPAIKSAKELEKNLVWSEDSLVAEIGPTDSGIIKMFKAVREDRNEKYLAMCEAKMANIRAELVALSARMVEFLEKIPVTPQYLPSTNCADLPVFAIIG